MLEQNGARVDEVDAVGARFANGDDVGATYADPRHADFVQRVEPFLKGVRCAERLDRKPLGRRPAERLALHLSRGERIPVFAVRHPARP
jgi:hypothetical protein